METDGEPEVHKLAAAIVEPVKGSESQRPLFADLQMETYEEILVSDELSTSQSREVSRLLFEYKNIFNDVPLVTTLRQHTLELESNEPISDKAYVLLHAMRDIIIKELDTMERLGV